MKEHITAKRVIRMESNWEEMQRMLKNNGIPLYIHDQECIKYEQIKKRKLKPRNDGKL